MTEARYRYWGSRKPVTLARPAETVEMAAGATKTAKIRLYGPIDSWGAPFGVAASEVADALDQAGAGTAIEMHVHSPGGDAFEGLAIMNLLRQHKGGVDVVVDGLCASAASIVAMGAATVTMVPGSQMMVHDASALAIGQADDMRQAADMLDSISSNAADQYAAKSGKPSDEMRAAMKATTWLKAQEAVDAGLADSVLASDTEQAQQAAKAAASLAFDLSIYPNAPTAEARCQCGSNGSDVSADARMQHKVECPVHTPTPADQPVTPPTDHKEADTMSDTIPKAGLVKALGLPDDADEDAILDALDTKVKATAPTPEPTPAPEPTPPPVPAGHVVVSADALEELKIAAKAGQEARAIQLRAERDDAIRAAVRDGKVAPARAAHWTSQWDADPEGTKAALDSLDAVYPVGPVKGHQGDPDQESADVMSDAQAEALAATFGVPKEALING